VPTYAKRSVFDADAATLFSWHARPGAFERLMPPWEHLRVLSRHGGIADGSRLTMELRKGPFRTRWEALHRNFEEGRQFEDVQVAGPFKRWVHTHLVEPEGPSRATLTDYVDYALPLGPLGALVGGRAVRNLLERTFTYRHRRIETDLRRHRAVGKGRRLRVVMTGRTGFVLTQLASFLSTGGHYVHIFPTSEDARVHPSHLAWGPVAVPDIAALQQADAVVHMGLGALPALIASLTEHRSRATTIIALPTVDLPGTPESTAEELLRSLEGVNRRIVVVLTPGVLAAAAAVEGLVPEEALTPSLDGALVGLDDLIGATHFALCSDAVSGCLDVALPRPAATAAVPPAMTRFVPEVRLIRMQVPPGIEARPAPDAGFERLNPSLAETIRAELGWPEGGNEP
jgi:ligand-binding SRPBCC domain-containing protein